MIPAEDSKSKEQDAYGHGEQGGGFHRRSPRLQTRDAHWSRCGRGQGPLHHLDSASVPHLSASWQSNLKRETENKSAQGLELKTCRIGPTHHAETQTCKT